MADIQQQLQLGGFGAISWKSEEYRRKVRSQIDEALQNAVLKTSKTSHEMEDHVFQKAKSRDEYLGLVARLIIHFRDNNAKKNKDVSGAMTMANMGQQGMVPNMIQNGHSQVMRPQMMPQHPGMHPGPRGPPMGMPMGGPGMGMPMQHPPGHNMTMQPHMMQQGPQRMPEYMMHGSPMGHPVHSVHPGHQVHPGHPGNMQQHSPHQYPMAPSIEHFMSYPPLGPRSHLAPPRICPPRPMSPEEIVLSSQMPQTSPVMVQQQSPAPISQLVPSPAMMTTPSPQQYQMAPSPASRLQQNIEQQQQQMNASGNVHSVEDLAYLEKLKQLSRFIEPLRRMIAQTERIEGSNKESAKLHKLLDVLLNPGTRVRMAALLKCEEVLEKMNFDVKPRPSEQHMCMPLMEAVRQHINSTTINHTLQRTLGPSLAQIHGPPLCSQPAASRKRKLSVDDDSEEESDISDVLQGEVARLERKFKVTLDPAYQSSSTTVHVICRIEDKTLPHVPPILVSIPRDYPQSSPDCKTGEDYGCTPFLQRLDKAFKQRLDKMPDNFSLTAILSAWELSIRQVCAT